MPVIMLGLLPLYTMMPEFSALNCFPPYILTVNDVFGITFTGTSLAEITLPMTHTHHLPRSGYYAKDACT